MKLEFTDIKVGMLVRDTDENEGEVIQCNDIHDIILEYRINGMGIYCLDANCIEYEPLFLITKYSEICT